MISGNKINWIITPNIPERKLFKTFVKLRLSFSKTYIDVSIDNTKVIRPLICEMKTFKIVGMLQFLSNPADNPYENNSINIKGKIIIFGIPDNEKLTRGEKSPEIAPAYGPAKSPTSIIGRCIGRNTSPGIVPRPEIVPRIWKIWGRITAEIIANKAANVCVLIET